MASDLFELNASNKPMDYFSFGHRGSPDAVWALGVQNLSDTDRQLLMDGCQKAAKEGAPQNLQTFFSAYIAYRWQKATDYYFLDDGYRRFFVNPAMESVCQGVTPGTQALNAISAVTPALQRRHALYLLLEAAVAADMNFQAEGIINAGADVNMCLSRAILIAFENGNKRLLRALHAGDANFFAAAQQLKDPDAKKELELLHYKLQNDEDRAEIKQLRENMADITGRLETAEKEKAALLKAAEKPPAPVVPVVPPPAAPPPPPLAA